MRILTTFVILFLFIAESFGQMEYEKGYFINLENKKIECLIKNLEWKYNPTEFSYKLNDSATPQKGNVSSVREFGISNCFKFIVADVKMDRSIEPSIGPNNELTPVWSQEKVFLKVLQEGKAKLYSYEAKNIRRFFYTVNELPLTQLVYLEAQNGSTVVKNTSYQQQLLGNLKYSGSNPTMIKEVDYTQKDLQSYFKAFNISLGESGAEVNNKRKSYFNLKLAPGFNSSSVSMTTVVGYANEQSQVNFETKPGFRLGLESELIIPFNKYRWGILFEPTFQNYSAEAGTEAEPSAISSNSIEFPIGLRYYLPVNDNTKIYLNAFYIPGAAMNMNSNVEYYVHFTKPASLKTVDISSGSSAALGGGVDYKRFSLEARYYTTRNLLNDSPTESADYSRFSFILGYKLLKTRLK